MIQQTELYDTIYNPMKLFNNSRMAQAISMGKKRGGGGGNEDA
jgi:hypothetical protein